MPKAFISYARDGSHGENLAIEIQQQLQAAGFAVFCDVTGLKPGDPWFHKLESELETSDVMVLVLSEKVRKSKWVHNEFSMAEEIGIPVIPVLAEVIRQPLWVRHLQILDFCGVRDWRVLLSAVRGRCEVPDVVELESDKPEIVLPGETKKIVRSFIGDKNSLYRKYQQQQMQPVWASDAGTDQYGRYADLLAKGVTQRFRWIEPGTFWMGSPASEPERSNDEVRHQVTLSKGYWLADTACTQALWQAVMGNNPAHFKDNENNPVEYISWDDTQEFFQTLNSMVSGLSACLPTEAQWEYACRAGTNTPFFFGDNITPEQVNFEGSRGQTISVKSLPANQWGLYEMHGNVWEWCLDWYGEYSAKLIIDPQGAKKGGDRVLRGSSWLDDSTFGRSAYRGRSVRNFRGIGIGFRISVGH